MVVGKLPDTVAPKSLNEQNAQAAGHVAQNEGKQSSVSRQSLQKPAIRRNSADNLFSLAS